MRTCGTECFVNSGVEDVDEKPCVQTTFLFDRKSTVAVRAVPRVLTLVYTTCFPLT